MYVQDSWNMASSFPCSAAARVRVPCRQEASSPLSPNWCIMPRWYCAWSKPCSAAARIQRSAFSSDSSTPRWPCSGTLRSAGTENQRRRSGSLLQFTEHISSLRVLFLRRGGPVAEESARRALEFQAPRGHSSDRHCSWARGRLASGPSRGRTHGRVYTRQLAARASLAHTARAHQGFSRRHRHPPRSTVYTQLSLLPVHKSTGYRTDRPN